MFAPSVIFSPLELVLPHLRFETIVMKTARPDTCNRHSKSQCRTATGVCVYRNGLFSASASGVAVRRYMTSGTKDPALYQPGREQIPDARCSVWMDKRLRQRDKRQDRLTLHLSRKRRRMVGSGTSPMTWLFVWNCKTTCRDER